MSSLLTDLGLTFGPHETRTTFADSGQVGSQDSPLRLAYRHVMPTALGFLAGAVEILRFAEVKAALDVALAGRTDKTLFQHLLRVAGSQLTAVFGDDATLTTLRRYLEATHRRTIAADKLPQWYRSVISPQPFSPAMRVEPVFYTVSAAIGRAHMAAGLVSQQDAGAYYDDLMRTAGSVNGIEHNIGSYDISYLTEVAVGYARELGMNTSSLQAARIVPDLLTGILGERISDIATVADVAPLFIGLMTENGREAFGLGWTFSDQERLDRWSAEYAARDQQLRLCEAALPKVSHDFSPAEFFTVSRRGI